LFSQGDDLRFELLILAKVLTQPFTGTQVLIEQPLFGRISFVLEFFKGTGICRTTILQSLDFTVQAPDAVNILFALALDVSALAVNSFENNLLLRLKSSDFFPDLFSINPRSFGRFGFGRFGLRANCGGLSALPGGCF